MTTQFLPICLNIHTTGGNLLNTTRIYRHLLRLTEYKGFFKKIYHKYYLVWTGDWSVPVYSGISQVNVRVSVPVENVDGVCQDTRLLVLLLARQIDPIVSVSRHEDESEDDDHYQKEEGGEVLADLSDGVGETPEVRVGVRALRDDGQVADGSVCQVAGRGTLEAVVLAW